MHRYRHSLWLSLPLALLALSGARAEPVVQIEEPSEVHPLFSGEVALARNALSDQAISESRDWRRIRLRKGAGLEVRREINLGERDIVLGVKGPLMKKKRLGLAFELRF